MKFLYPQFLFALFGLAVPIIVHLFNFRRFKRVLFTNVRFLQEIKQDTRHRSRLKHLLVLAARLLALSFLVFAFAQPYLPAEKGAARAARNRVSIWVDNSFSMNAQGKYGPLLDVAREKAREIALSYAPSDQFQLVTNDFEGRHQRLVNRDEFLQLLEEVRPSSAVRTLDEVLRRQHDAFTAAPTANGEQQASFLVSDFQSSLAPSGPAATLPLDSATRYFIVALTAQAINNVYVDTCYLNNPFIQPGSTQELTVSVKNAGEDTVENLPIKLSINGNQRALATVNVAAGASADVKLPFNMSGAGQQQAVVSITDYPVTFDDSFYFAFNVRPNVQVMSIGDRSAYLDALYSNDPYFIYRTVSEGQVDYNTLPSQQLVLLNGVQSFATGLQQELTRFMTNGGRVLLIPSPEQNAVAYDQFSQAAGLPRLTGPSATTEKVSRLESDHPLLSGIFEKGKTQAENLDLPAIRQQFTQSYTSSSGSQSILTTENGLPFLSFTPVGKGGCFVLSVPLDPAYSNFQQHALFVPIFLKAVFLGASEIGPGQITGRFAEFSAGDTVLSGDQVYHVINSSCNFDAIADVRRNAGATTLSLHDAVKVAGNYSVQADGRLLNVVAFNYDRKESDLTAMEAAALEKWFAGQQGLTPTLLDADDPSIGHSLARLREGVSLWKYCIIAALLFLAAEVLFIRYFKK